MSHEPRLFGGSGLQGPGQTPDSEACQGKHIITLGVDDGKKNGIATAQVRDICEAYSRFKAILTVDVATPTRARRSCFGKTDATGGDGSIRRASRCRSGWTARRSRRRTIESIEPDADFPLEFQWNAVKGDHKLEVTGQHDQNFSKNRDRVAKKPSGRPPEADMTTWIAVASVVAVIAAVALVAAFSHQKEAHAGSSLRRRRAIRTGPRKSPINRSRRRWRLQPLRPPLHLQRPP